MMTEERWKVMQDRKRLEEAAPDLLAACMALTDQLHSLTLLHDRFGIDPGDAAAIKAGNDAIAKATGEETRDVL